MSKAAWQRLRSIERTLPHQHELINHPLEHVFWLLKPAQAAHCICHITVRRGSSMASVAAGA